jgi:type II secretory pathway component PulK
VGSGRQVVGSGVMMMGKTVINPKLMNMDTVLPTAARRLPTEKGVILIALLWILTAISVIALSFSRESFVEVAAARNAQSLEKAYFVARAGIAATVYQLMQRRIMPSVRQAGFQDTPDPLELGSVTGSFGGGTYQVDIQDEAGKLNINTVSEEQLRLLILATGIEAHDADIITDSILDWRDADSDYHLNGAEDDYYQTLNPPQVRALEMFHRLLDEEPGQRKLRSPPRAPLDSRDAP